jgi:hypothetical protein
MISRQHNCLAGRVAGYGAWQSAFPLTYKPSSRPIGGSLRRVVSLVISNLFLPPQAGAFRALLPGIRDHAAVKMRVPHIVRRSCESLRGMRWAARIQVALDAFLNMALGGRSVLWILGALGVLIALPVAGVLWMTSVPGQSHAGPLPSLTPDQVELSKRLQDHIRAIASSPHNVGYPQELEQAALYIEAALAGMGYEVHR